MQTLGLGLPIVKGAGGLGSSLFDGWKLIAGGCVGDESKKSNRLFL